jgi:hypothetical protein
MKEGTGPNSIAEKTTSKLVGIIYTKSDQIWTLIVIKVNFQK